MAFTAQHRGCDWSVCAAADGESKLGFSEAAKQEEVGLTTRRGRYTRDLDQQFGSQRAESEDGESFTSTLTQQSFSLTKHCCHRNEQKDSFRLLDSLDLFTASYLC